MNCQDCLAKVRRSGIVWLEGACEIVWLGLPLRSEGRCWNDVRSSGWDWVSPGSYGTCGSSRFVLVNGIVLVRKGDAFLGVPPPHHFAKVRALAIVWHYGRLPQSLRTQDFRPTSWNTHLVRVCCYIWHNEIGRDSSMSHDRLPGSCCTAESVY